MLREATDARHTALFIHDFLTDSRLFALMGAQDPLIDSRLLALDLRGFGRTLPPVGPYSHAHDILETAAAGAPGTKVHLVAAGYGGIQALEAAILDGSHNIASVTVLSSGLPGHAWPRDAYLNITEAFKGMAGPKDAARWKSAFVRANQAWRDVLARGDRPVVDALGAMVLDYSGFHFLKRDTAMRLDDAPLSERLAQVRVPVLAAAGARDPPDFLKIAAEIAAGVPVHARENHVVVPDAGHFCTLENPQAVAEMLAGFWHSLGDTGMKILTEDRSAHVDGG